MSVSGEVDRRISGPEEMRSAGRLPHRLGLDRSAVRVLVLQRLAASRLVARGSAAGALRSSRPSTMRVDLRQRVIVKALVARHAPGRLNVALAKHLGYLARPGAGRDGERGVFFDAAQDQVDVGELPTAWARDRHHFRFIVSPEHGDRLPDMAAYTRGVMTRVAEDLGEPKLQWLAMAHFDTDQPHAHVLVRGKRQDGRDLVIPRRYMGYGFRARATEVAQELLGDLSRDEAERRVWRETQADRFTRFDRTLLAEAAEAAETDGAVPGAMGRPGSYGALLRGRLNHLEQLGLATWTKGAFRLDPQLEAKLRRLELGGDVIRTLNQRRLEGGREVVQARAGSLRGVVVKSGFHDELGAQPYAIIHDQMNRDVYVRMRLGGGSLEAGSQVAGRVDDFGRFTTLQNTRRAGLEI